MDKQTYDKIREVEKAINHAKQNYDPIYSRLTDTLIDFLDRTAPHEWDSNFDQNDNEGITVFMPVRIPGSIMGMIEIAENQMGIKPEKLISFVVKRIFHEGLLTLAFQAMNLSQEAITELKKEAINSEDNSEKIIEKINRLSEIVNRYKRSNKI